MYRLSATLFALVCVADGPAPRELLKPTNLAPINTAKDEDDPWPSSDGLTLYYASNSDGKWNLLSATRRTRNMPWSAGKTVPGFVQSGADDRSMYVTPVGRFPQYLYYATRKDESPDANFDLYVAVRQNRTADWTAPTPLHTLCTPNDEMHPWLTPDGKQLYFSRRTKDGWRVFVAGRSKGTGAGGFDAAKLVDLPVGYHHATLTPNAQSMYLQAPVGNGRWGIFRSNRMGVAWAKPEALDQLNHPEGPTGDGSPALSAAGTFLYFTSDRPGGKGGRDLWVIPTADLGTGAK